VRRYNIYWICIYFLSCQTMYSICEHFGLEYYLIRLVQYLAHVHSIVDLCFFFFKHIFYISDFKHLILILYEKRVLTRFGMLVSSYKPSTRIVPPRFGARLKPSIHVIFLIFSVKLFSNFVVLSISI